MIGRGMKINRRGFLTLVPAAAAVAVAPKVEATPTEPVPWEPAPPRFTYLANPNYTGEEYFDWQGFKWLVDPA
jgi:hypothetical protein